MQLQPAETSKTPDAVWSAHPSQPLFQGSGRLGCSVALAALLVSGPALEEVAAQWPDSPLIPSGSLRLEILPSFHGFNERFGQRVVDGLLVEENERLGWPLTSQMAGTTLLPGLLGEESALASVLGDPSYRYRLGRTAWTVNADESRIPLSARVGVTSWLTIGATVPFVRRRVESDFLLSPDGVNVGVNPAFSDPTDFNAFLGELENSLTSLRAERDVLCAGGGDCAGIERLLGEGEGLLNGLTTSVNTGLLFPLALSEAGDRLTTLVNDVRAGMQGFGIELFTALIPFPNGPINQDEFQALFLRPLFGEEGLPFEPMHTVWEMGDVEFFAVVKILGSEEKVEPGSSSGLRYRGILGGLLRLSTGTADSLATFLDFGSRSGQQDVELQFVTEAALGERWMGRAEVKLGFQSSGAVVRRILPVDLFATAQRPAPDAPPRILERAPGNYFELGLFPRVRLTRGLLIGPNYRMVTRGADEFRTLGSLEGEEEVFDVAVLAEKTEATTHEIGLEVIFSPLDVRPGSFSGRVWEVRARYQKAFAGSGGRTPKGARFEAALRMFISLWGSN